MSRRSSVCSPAVLDIIDDDPISIAEAQKLETQVRKLTIKINKLQEEEEKAFQRIEDTRATA